MTADRGPQSCGRPISWSVENEIHLFDAMTGYKPVGVNKHFQMLVILERFCSRVQRDVPASIIWERLNQLYDMSALDELENLPFPNAESEFGLPSDEFDALMQERLRRSEQRDEERRSQDDEPRTPRDEPRRSRARDDRSTSSTREKRKSDASDSVRRAPKRATRESTGKAASPAGTPVTKRSRRI